MFKLIAFLFLASNPSAPDAQLRHHTTFPTEEACKGYFDTKQGEADKAAIDNAVAAQNGKIIVKFACVKIEGESM